MPIIKITNEPITIQQFLKEHGSFQELAHISPNFLNKTQCGLMFFSQKEWKIARDRGWPRLFCIMTDSRIVEYTELISMDMLEEDQNDTCPFDDARFLGFGAFHHRMDDRGSEYGIT